MSDERIKKTASCERLLKGGARKGTRTPDLLITNEPHYQLCYPGVVENEG